MRIVADANIPFVQECFSSIGEVEVAAGREMPAETLKDADVLLVRSVTKVDGKLLGGSKIQFVGTATIGFEHIDRDYLNKNKIGFASAPGSNANSVAEYIVAALLAVAEKQKIQLQGKSIGIVGVGNVGSKVEAKCRSLGMQEVLNDPPLERETGDDRYRSIAEVFDCDIVTLHTPLTHEGKDKTFHLADEKFFDFLKDGAVFINTSRGGVVDTAALKRAIKNSKVSATVLDVWEDEPAIDTELLEMVDIGTPHIAGYSFDGKVGGMVMIYNAVCKHFGIEPRISADNFLGDPAVPKLTIEPRSASVQEVLQKTVEFIYDIGEDDKRLRQILNMPLGKRCATFDRLRKEYPKRREFQNTTISLATPADDMQGQAEESEGLLSKLEGIGFSTQTDQRPV